VEILYLIENVTQMLDYWKIVEANLLGREINMSELDFLVNTYEGAENSVERL
jgi:hypothetical protein